MRKITVYLLVFSVLANVCFADIMPKKVDKSNVTKAGADLSTAKMTAADLKYFAEDNNRVQLAGQVPAHAMWWHWVYGWSLFFGTAWGVYSLINHTE